MTNDSQGDLPFTLPSRPAVRRLRKLDQSTTPSHERVQPMAGFEPRFTDIVDYIVRITDEIWQERAIGYIRETYDPLCTVYSSYGVVRSVEPVVRSTLASISALPDGDTNHLNVAWSGDEEAGFYTAHLGFGGGINRQPTIFGPPSNRTYTMRFAADCISRANLIHTEWLVRDAGAYVRQLGFDLDDASRAVAETLDSALLVEIGGDGSPAHSSAKPGTLEHWAHSLFDGVWNERRFDRLGQFYAPDVVVHSGGGRTIQGLQAFSTFLIQLIASIPDGRVEIGHVCWSDETDGVIVAVRWLLTGSTARGGLLGHQLPRDRGVFMMGSSHLRMNHGRIVEEWTVFDEVAVLAMAYRG